MKEYVHKKYITLITLHNGMCDTHFIVAAALVAKEIRTARSVLYHSCATLCVRREVLSINNIYMPVY